ncbi:crotonase/enoyl-CoA hydratase family protein [Suttonella sp. R2A3]|uniref:crotonase/enoyl-CoA hydratase family protein n=1 Tax=Suttonella sp. R2A3 TaxID=2908648 RepID=UPI001F2AF3F4|nr:crotonase/enoyl-CoA hydratase family protein [Suttonella sp. R2A3]UJF24655.1 crotonase/enoyl-CoA hydratase family protein [Suttonella sp. R2A3]
MNTFSTLELTQNDGIATLTLSRPKTKNAMSFTMMRELVRAANQLKQNRSIRAVILRGDGVTFCSGIDLSDLNQASKSWIVWQLLKPGLSLFQAACLAWHKLPIPVIAAVEGHCLGAGTQLALAADYVIATADSEWSVREAHWGIVPDMGISVTALGKIHQSTLLDATYSARLFSGEHAVSAGFAQELNGTPYIAAQRLAKEWAQRSPDALLGSKRVIKGMLGASRLALYREKWWQIKLLLGKNQRIAVRKGQGKDATFKPRQYR